MAVEIATAFGDRHTVALKGPELFDASGSAFPHWDRLEVRDRDLVLCLDECGDLITVQILHPSVRVGDHLAEVVVRMIAARGLWVRQCGGGGLRFRMIRR